MRTLCIGIAVSGWCLACSDASAALALRAAIDAGRCGARLLPHRVNLLHAIASDPRLPLRPPSFFSSNAPPRVVHNVSCPRLASPLYAGMDPWIARGGLDPIGALVDAMTRAKPFESAAMTMARLFLRDKASARRTFVCAIVRANSPSVRGNDGFARYPSASIDGDLTRFLHTFAPSLDAVDAEVRAICPRLPRLADAALAAARRCDGAAEALARLLVDHWMALEATELYNPASANPMGFLNLAGVSPSTLLYATPYPQTAAQYGSVVAVFSPSQRGLDLRHFYREGRFRAHFTRTGHTSTRFLEPLPAAGEIIVPGYLDEPVLGFELRRPMKPLGDIAALIPGAPGAREFDEGMIESIVQSHNVLVTAGVYAVRFLGVSLLAVVVPPANVSCVVPPFSPLQSAASPPQFIACELALRAPFAPLFPLPVPRPDVHLPVAAVLFAPDNATDASAQCRAATALLSGLNARFDPAREVPPLDTRTRAVVDALLAARGMMETTPLALGRCTGAAARPRGALRVDNSHPPPPLLAAVVADLDAPAQPWCSAVVVNGSRSDAALDNKGFRGSSDAQRLEAGMGEEVAWPQRGGPASCRLVCSPVGAFVPAQGETDGACARAAASLGLAALGAPALKPVWWPEERLHAMRACDDAGAAELLEKTADDVSVGALEFAFVAVATRLRGVSEARRAAALANVESWTREHVHVVRLDLDADIAGVYHVAGIAIRVTRNRNEIVLEAATLRILVDERTVAARGGAALFKPERMQPRSWPAWLLWFAACIAVASWAAAMRRHHTRRVHNKVKL